MNPVLTPRGHVSSNACNPAEAICLGSGANGIEVIAGQVWQRRDGSQFKITHCTPGYAHYWLNAGSRPQYRDIRIDLLTKRYRLVNGSPIMSPRGHAVAKNRPTAKRAYIEGMRRKFAGLDLSEDFWKSLDSVPMRMIIRISSAILVAAMAGRDGWPDGFTGGLYGNDIAQLRK